MPDEVSKKSLKVLDKKVPLAAPSEHADFHVNINFVLWGVASARRKMRSSSANVPWN